MTLFLDSRGVPHTTRCPAHLGLPQHRAAGKSWRSSAGAGDTAPVLPCGAWALLRLSFSWEILTFQRFLCPTWEQRVEAPPLITVTEPLKCFVLENTEMPV